MQEWSLLKKLILIKQTQKGTEEESQGESQDAVEDGQTNAV